MEPIKRGQVTLPVVVYAVTVIAFGLALFRLVHLTYHQHYHQHYYPKCDRYVAHFQSLHGVENVHVEPWEHEGYYYVGAIEFTIKSVPDSFVKLEENTSMLGQRDDDVEHLCLVQLGPWQFHDQDSSCIVLGTDGWHSQLLPVEIHSVGDIIERYSELVAFFPDTEVAGVTVVAAEDRKRFTRRPGG